MFRSKEVIQFKAQKTCRNKEYAEYEAKEILPKLKFNFDALFENEIVVVSAGSNGDFGEIYVRIHESVDSDRGDIAKMRRVSSFLYEYMSDLGWGPFRFIDSVKVKEHNG